MIMEASDVFSALDFIFAALLLISLVVGVFRGLCRELITVLTWGLALVLAVNQTPAWMSLSERWIDSPAIRYAATFFVLFLLVVLVGALINVLVGRLIRGSGFSGIDRLLGAVFGLARTLVLVSAVVFLAGPSSVSERDWWQNSQVVAVSIPLLCGDRVQGVLDRIQPSGRWADWLGETIAWDSVCPAQ